MAIKGVRAESLSAVTNFEAGYNPSHTTETLIGYIACYQQLVCPAMNQGTFKYTKLSAIQGVRSLKLIHHSFR